MMFLSLLIFLACADFFFLGEMVPASSIPASSKGLAPWGSQPQSDFILLYMFHILYTNYVFLLNRDHA